MKVFSSVNEAYQSGLQDIKALGRLVPSVTDKTSVGSHFGKRLKDYKEIIGYSFILENPRNRVITNSPRNMSFGFAVANFLWVLTGRRDVESISFYNSKGRAFSSDGEYYESAFGDRLFGTYKQWDKIKSRLLNDKSSRRAFLPLYFPQDLIQSPLDLSCATGIQFLIRDDRLEFVLHMRSQSAAMVFPYDIFLFSLLHEYFSLELGVGLGKFYYYAASFHYYNEEEDSIEKILSNNSISDPGVMPSMDRLNNEGVVRLYNAESEIRECILGKRPFPVEVLSGFSKYWQSMLITAWQKGCLENNHTIASLDLTSINEFKTYAV
ncbi:MAG: thymidylate synthase [Gammaproteobacteria bacterium]|nr:thymidylate synthase [Gammaproteobacteria bacterium]